ncbi:unnamed protein product [Closterium sp. NIES-54]
MQTVELHQHLVLRTSELILLVRSAAAARARVAMVVEGVAGVVMGAAVEVVEAVEVVAPVGMVAGVGVLVAAVEAVVGVAAVEAVGLVAVGLELGLEVFEVASVSSSSVRATPSRPSSFGDRAGQTCGKLHTQHRCFSRLDDAWRAEFGDDVELSRWADLLRSRIAIFDLDFDAILSAIYALSVSAEGDCYRCVSPNPGIAAAALGASESGALPGTAPAQALHTFTLDSRASRCLFRDSTTLTPLLAPVLVTLANPSRGPVVARSSTVLPCSMVPSGSLSGLHLTSFSANLVSTTALQDAMVTTTTPGGQRVSICTCTQTGRHLATFSRRSGSSLYTLATEPSQVAKSARVSASGQVAASCSCCLLSHQTLLWHHRLGHHSLPRLRGMHSRLLVSGLPRSLPPLPPLPPPPCLPCVEGRQRAAPLFSSFPPTTAPLQTLHMDVWGQARVSGQSRKRYFLLLRERFRLDLPVLRLHSDRGGEFSSNLLQEFCCGEGILQSFTLPDSPQQNGTAERRIGLVMEVARTSMIRAAAPHFLWLFAVQYAAHQLNLWPRVSLPETSPTLLWTGKVGDALMVRVWGSRAFVRDPFADKLSACASPSVFLGFVPDAPGWQFYHPTSCRVLPSEDVTFDELVPFYCLFPHRSAPLPPPPIFLAPGPPPVDPPPGAVPGEVAMDSGAARGTASGGAELGGAGPGGAEPGGAETGGAMPRGVETEGAERGGAEREGVEPWGAASEGAESGGAEPQVAALSGGSAGASLRLSPRQLREWFVRRARLWSGATGAGGAGSGGAGVAAGAGCFPTSATPTRPSHRPVATHHLRSRAAEQHSHQAAEPPEPPSSRAAPAPEPPEPPELPEPPEPPSSRAASAARAARAARAAELPYSSTASTPASVSRPSGSMTSSCSYSDRADGLSLFDLTSGASPAPPATADSTVRSQWATRDAAARLAVRRHLPTTERAHFSQYRSAQTLYDAVVARYSSPATAALSRLFLPYLRFYHPTSRRVLSSQDVTFDESVPYYRLFPYRTAPLPPPPLFLAPGPPPVDPLPPQGPAPSGVSQVDAVEPVEVAVESGATTGAEPAGAGSRGAGSGGAETGGAEPGGAETGGAEPGGAERGGAESGGAEPWGAESGGAERGGTEPGGAGTEPGGTEPGGAESTRVSSRGASSRREVLSPRELREWFARRWGRAAGAGGTAEAAGVGPTGGLAGASGGTGAAGSAGTGATGVGATGGVGAGGSTDAGTSEGAGAGAPSTGAPAGSPGPVPASSGGAPRPRPYFVPPLEQVLGLPPSPGPAPPLECPQPVQSQSLLRPVSPLPAPSPYTGPTGGLAERRAPASRPASPARPACTSRRASRPRPPAVPGTHQMALRPSTAPLRVPLPSPPASSLPASADPESDSLRAASPSVARFLATVVSDPSLASTAASALVAELVDFAARCRLDYTASLIAESASVCPPSVGGECALSTDVLEDRQEEIQCFAAALPHLVSTLLAPEGDPDAPDILTPRSYAEAIEGPYPSQWQAAMDAEMASWKSTGTYVDDVPPPGANIVSSMWIFRVKRPPGSPPVFKARYVARGFGQRHGVDYFQTFSPTPKMTTLQVLLHVAAQRDYELHSLDFSTAFLQGSLHKEIRLRRPPGFMWIFKVKRPPGSPPVFKARYVARGFSQ